MYFVNSLVGFFKFYMHVERLNMAMVLNYQSINVTMLCTICQCISVGVY
jgi:hypothetical protein